MLLKNIIKIISELKTKNYTTIIVNNIFTKKIPITKGIRQGDSLNPTLSNIIMDQVIKPVRDSRAGYTRGNKKINIICYVYDAVLMAENEYDLQRLLQIINQHAENDNMEISAHNPWLWPKSSYDVRWFLM